MKLKDPRDATLIGKQNLPCKNGAEKADKLGSNGSTAHPLLGWRRCGAGR